MILIKARAAIHPLQVSMRFASFDFTKTTVDDDKTFHKPLVDFEFESNLFAKPALSLI